MTIRVNRFDLLFNSNILHHTLKSVTMATRNALFPIFEFQNFTNTYFRKVSKFQFNCFSRLGLWGVTCICRDTGMCHYFGYFFLVAARFLGIFLAILGFWVSCLGYSRIFGYRFFFCII